MYIALPLALVILLTPPVQDTLVVRSRGPGLWGDRPRLVEELRIGKLEGAQEYLLGDVAGIAVGRDGSIVVADGQGPILRMYDAKGRFLRNLGRRGEGPGEYNEILGIRTLSDGRFATWDPQNRRINVYDPAGRSLDHHTVQAGLFTDDVFAIDTANNFYVKETDRRNAPPCPANQSGQGFVCNDELPMILIKVSPEGEVLDSIGLPMEGAPPSFVLSTSEGWVSPFVRATTHAWSPFGYLVVGHTSRYVLNLLKPNQRVLRIERQYTPAKINPAEKAQWEAWRDFLNRDPDGRRVNVTIPATKPAFRDISVDDDGRIWVDRYVEARQAPPGDTVAGEERPQLTWREPRTFDVFQADGLFLGTIVLPAGTYIHVRRGMHVWGTRRGELDENYVVRFRIDPSAGTRSR